MSSSMHAMSFFSARVVPGAGVALDDPDAEPLFDVVLEETSSRRFDARDHLALFARELLVLRSGRRSKRSARIAPR